MGLVRCLAVLIVAGATVPAAAAADPSWGVPAGIDGISSATTLLTTQIGGRVLVGMSSSRSLASPTVVARVTANGSISHVQTLDLAFARAASFRRAGIVVAGARPGLSSQAAQQAPVLVALGSVRGIHGVGAPRALPGTRGQWVLAVAGNPANGTIALVTGSMYNPGPPTRTLWVRRGKAFRRTLTVRPGTRSPEAAVAVGARGDVLFVWQAHRAIHARYIGRRGHVGVLHRLGAGIQSSLQARIADSGRLEVAWESQQVAEGDALTPATVTYVSAPRGRPFARARIVGGSSLTGTGRSVMRPGVRLVGTGKDRSALAWTQYDGAHFGVQVADVVAGSVGRPRTVSPAGTDAVLGDLAWSARGGQIVLWLTNTRGNDGVGPQRVAASVRPPGAAAFGAPELVSEPVADGAGRPATEVVTPPGAAVDVRDGQAFAVWATLDQHVKIAVRATG